MLYKFKHGNNLNKNSVTHIMLKRLGFWVYIVKVVTQLYTKE